LVLGNFALMLETGKLRERDRDGIHGALVAALDDPHELLEVRRRSLESLGVFQSPDVGEWIRRAYDGNEPAMRQSAVYAMGKSCDPVWLPSIIDELGSDEPGMRYEAVNASSEQASEDAVPHLFRILDDDDPQVQMSVIHALGVIGGDAARTALRRLAESDDEAVQEAAEEALGLADLDQADPSMRLGMPEA
jgi:HEAT repeat protein